MIVLDTNVLSELMRAEPSPAVKAWVRAQPSDDLCTTAVTVAEIGYGIARLPDGKRRSSLGRAAEDVFDAFAESILAFDDRAARRYGELVAQRDADGQPISGFDAQIAAVCLTRRASLATRNIDDFAGLDLVLINPWDHR